MFVRRPLQDDGTPEVRQHCAATSSATLTKLRREHWPGRILGLIAPHAGYAYSGPTAAQGLRAGARRVVQAGSSPGTTASPDLGQPAWARSWSRPRMPIARRWVMFRVDRDFIDELGRRIALTPVKGDEEHALEIELPFLQVALERFSLVPIMLGDHISHPHAAERVSRLSEALAATGRRRDAFGRQHRPEPHGQLRRCHPHGRAAGRSARRFDVDGVARGPARRDGAGVRRDRPCSPCWRRASGLAPRARRCSSTLPRAT